MKIKSIISFDFIESRSERLQSFILVYLIVNIIRLTLSILFFFSYYRELKNFTKNLVCYIVFRALYMIHGLFFTRQISINIFLQFTITKSGHRVKYTECETRL